MAFLHAFVPHDREARTPLFLREETGAENLLPSVQFLFLRLVVFPVLLPLCKQGNGDVMEDWWASCFLPPLLVASLRGLLCFFEKKQRNESFFLFFPRFCFSSGFSVMSFSPPLPVLLLWFL
ncbi:hypothetical protein Peur_063190 [Populus x canadensis]